MLLFFGVTEGLSLQHFDIRSFELNGKLYNLEIADTRQRKTQGLMYRKKLAQDAGMLFVYRDPGDRRIWMKNTEIPLAVLWLDEKARIIGKKVLQPCYGDPCPVASVSKPAQFVLELHPDQVSRFRHGDRLTALLKWQRQGQH